MRVAQPGLQPCLPPPPNHLGHPGAWGWAPSSSAPLLQTGGEEAPGGHRPGQRLSECSGQRWLCGRGEAGGVSRIQGSTGGPGGEDASGGKRCRVGALGSQNSGASSRMVAVVTGEGTAAPRGGPWRWRRWSRDTRRCELLPLRFWNLSHTPKQPLWAGPFLCPTGHPCHLWSPEPGLEAGWQ